ncbi:MAG: hypothetical protein JSV03_12260, partial [Planctomycetota bacterium]
RGIEGVTPDFDYPEYLDYLESLNHNFIRLWVWEHATWMQFEPPSIKVRYKPLPYPRTGPGNALDGGLKFDINQFYQPYFDRLRDRIIQAGNRDMYVAVMLFQGFSIEQKQSGCVEGLNPSNGNPWEGHPYNPNNNINGVDGDADNDNNGRELHTLQLPAITALQKTYVAKVIDTINDRDNIVWEISNESHAESISWQYHMIDYIKSYEAAYKPKQHPVGMTGYCFNNSYLFASPADWISPNKDGGYRDNPPAADGSKIVVSDTDHLWGLGGDRAWVWKSFCRGLNPIFMDSYKDYRWGSPPTPDPTYDPIRIALGHTRIYAEKMNLVMMTPQNSLSSTTYCLANPGSEYLVYQPSSGQSFTVNLVAGTYDYEWFNCNLGTLAQTGSVTVSGGSQSFTPPFSGEAALYLNGCGIIGLPEQASNPYPQHQAAWISIDLTCSWNTSQCANSYNVYFGETGQLLFRGSQAMTTFNPGTLNRYTDYSWRVDTVNSYGTITGVVWDFTTEPYHWDLDYDYDVDQLDFGLFQACYSGTGNPPVGDCLAADFDDDNDVDLNDFNIFLGCATGTNGTIDPNCDN